MAPLTVSAQRAAHSVRDAIARQMARLPFDSTLLGPPRRAVDDLVSWLHEHPDQGELLAEEPGPAVDFGPIEGEDPLDLASTRHYQHPRTFVARLHRARLAGAVPTVITADDSIVCESIHCDPRYWSWTDVHRRLRLSRVRETAEPLVTLSYALSTGLHEWMVYALPRLYLAWKAGVDPGTAVLVPPHAPPWLFGSLQLAGVGDGNLQRFAGGHWRAPSMILPSVPSERPLPWVIAWLRQLAEARGTRPQNAGLRIYVTRRTAATRRVVNEAEVIAWLGARGFRAVDLGSMPFDEQLSLASRASIVVGPHGAGLTHVLFAAPGCLVAEFIEPSYVFPCFYWLAGVSAHRYRYLVAETVRQPSHSGGHGFDLRVPLESLERLLGDIG
jgi:hypothetical protein